MEILNKSDPRTEPSGTPCKSAIQELKWPQIFVLCHLLERYYL